MKELIRGLLTVSGGSGNEGGVAAAIKAQVSGVADEVFTDILGNLFAIKRPKGAGSGKTVMLIAPMDEPSVVITDIGENGYLRFEPLGRLQASALIGARVRVGRTGRLGVIGVESKADHTHLEFQHLFIDLRTADAASAAAYAQVGDTATFAYGMEELDDHTVIGHALGSRAACVVQIEAFKNANSSATIVAVFSSQAQVGSRGAQVAAYRIRPDLAVAIDISPTGDTPEAKRISLTLGGGAGIKALDRDMVVAPAIREQLSRAAVKAEVTAQIEVSPQAHSEAGAVFLSREGIPTGGVAIPVRYADTLSQMADLRDMTACVQVLEAFLSDL